MTNNSSVAVNETLSNEKTTSDRFNVMQILQSIIASVGITANLTVIIVLHLLLILLFIYMPIICNMSVSIYLLQATTQVVFHCCYCFKNILRLAPQYYQCCRTCLLSDVCVCVCVCVRMRAGVCRCMCVRVHAWAWVRVCVTYFLSQLVLIYYLCCILYVCYSVSVVIVCLFCSCNYLLVFVQLLQFVVCCL